MANSDKNILITPNVGASAQPTIKFTGADNTPITLRVLDNGTVSFEGTAGQLFSISDGLTGTIFSVNDISGIPSIEVIDTGEIRLAQYGGNIGIGTASASSRLQIVNASATVVPITIQGASAQTANLQEWKNNTGTVVGSFSNTSVLDIGASNGFTRIDGPNRVIQGRGGGTLYIGGSSPGSAVDGVAIDGNATSYATAIKTGSFSILRVGHQVNPNGATTNLSPSGITINPVINYAFGGTGGYTGLNIAITETALPTGPNYLINAMAGVSASTQMFYVTNAGAAYFASSASVTGNLFVTGTSNIQGRNTASDTAPVSPRVGDGWYDTNTGKQYVWYDSFWVEESSVSNAASIQIGTVTSVDSSVQATVTNSGTSQNAILDFRIPRGTNAAPLFYATFYG